MRGKYFRLGLLTLLFSLGVSLPTHAQKKRKTQKILIETAKPYDRVVAAIKARGGKVSYEYKYVDGVAAEVPEDAIEDIRAIVGSSALDKDVDVPRPTSVGPSRVRKQQTDGVVTARVKKGPKVTSLASYANSHPEAYSLNNAGTRIDKLHAKGFTGQGVIVAVIDSGIRPSFDLLTGSFVGGVDFVDDGPAGPAGDSDNDWKKDSNDGHGTFAAGLISGSGTFAVDSTLADALLTYAPKAFVDGKVPVIGTAPDSKLYIVRIFGNDSSVGASKSTVIAAMQHVIDQRQLYDQTRGRQGVNIQVVNLSVGVSTLAAGRALLDQSIDAMLRAGIVPVIAAGNAGPATLTIASPSSSFSGIAVGSLSRAANERILNEVYYGADGYPGIGGDIRPFDGTQTAYFSSRGPNADGRVSPDVVASGVGNLGQGFCPDQADTVDACASSMSIVSGTSFSAPIVAGVAASLRQAFPKATATQIRNAIISSARPGQIEDFFDVVDRGQGLVDAWGAYQLLAGDKVEDSLPRRNTPDDLVSRNIEQNTNLNVQSGFYSKTLRKLKPGERGEILYNVPKGTERVVVKLKNIVFSGQENVFYGETMYFLIHSAKTSAIAGSGDYPVYFDWFVPGEEPEYSLEDPDTGVMRLVVFPDTYNAGLVSVDVSVEAIREAWPKATISDTIRDGKTKKFTTEVKNGTSQMDLLMTWEHDWAHYPTSDLDLIVCSPDITTVEDCKANGIKDGATLAGPERVSIANPAAGNWMILVSGFNVPTGSDDFKVRIVKTRP